MENLISEYMRDAAIVRGRASVTYDETIECSESRREREGEI